MAKPAKRRVEGTGHGSRTDDTATDKDASAHKDTATPKDTATRKDTAKDTGPGNPSDVPQGTLTPGIPARFAVIV